MWVLVGQGLGVELVPAMSYTGLTLRVQILDETVRVWYIQFLPHVTKWRNSLNLV